MLTAEQIERRTHYIGGSDAAAVLGLSRWRTQLQVWAEKTGAVPIEDLSDVLAVEVGTELEDLVCKLFVKRTGKEVRRVNELQIHPNYSYIGAQIDRRVIGEDAILEAKTASAWKAKEWSGEDVPQEYILQCLHQLAVTGKSYCYIAVLIGGNQDFVWKRIDRDPKLIAEITRKEVEFWTKYVEPKVMPTVVKHQDSDILFKLFPEGDDGDAVTLSDDANKIIENVKAFQADAIKLDEMIEAERNRLKAMLGDKSAGVTNRWRVTWKNQNVSRVDMDRLKKEYADVYSKLTAPKPQRVLRLTEIAHGK